MRARLSGICSTPGGRTGPGGASAALHRTDQALLGLIGGATGALTIVSFAVYRIPEIAQALRAARRSARREAHESRIGIARSLLAQGMEPATVMEILGLRENDLS